MQCFQSSPAKALTVRRVRSSISRRSLKVICKAGTTPPAKTFDYATFAETINGRCAMQGFIWGSLKEVVTHETIMNQLLTKTYAGVTMDPYSTLQVASVIALVSIGTVFTSIINDASSCSSKTFTNDAEMLNGRVAMVGFLFLFFMF